MTVSDFSHWSLLTDPDTGESAGAGNRSHKSWHGEHRAWSLVRKREKKRAGRLGSP
jgi:hypothetical protein